MRIVKTLAWAILCVTVLCSPTFAQKPFEIAWTGERLTVHALNAPLGEVIAEVARQTGILIVGQEKLAGQLSIDFADLAPQEALTKLLADVNYIVQGRAGANGNTSSPLVVMIHSMGGSTLPAEAFSGPILVRELDVLMVVEANDVVDSRREEEEDDPDAVEDQHADKIQATALATQGAFGPKAPIDSLIKLMSSVNNEIRLEALKAIGTRPMPDALKALIGALGDEVWEVRNRSIEILGRATDVDSLRAVGETLLTSQDRDIRIDALRVLSLRGAPESADYLRAALKDADASIREVASLMLNELDRREQAKKRNGR